MIKLCQGTSCHMYDTIDRKRGTKGNKKNYTRTVGTYSYGNGNFCTLGCQSDWWAEHGTRAIDYIGRVRERKAMIPENSWVKRERYRWEEDHHVSTYYFRNVCTSEERPITEEQYNDNNYTLNTI
jgi:hypothetical protein